jgi:hypothetical protein
VDKLLISLRRGKSPTPKHAILLALLRTGEKSTEKEKFFLTTQDVVVHNASGTK